MDAARIRYGVKPYGSTRVRIRPDLGNLEWAEGTFPTPMGQISDPLETTDVASANPQVVARLEAEWIQWWTEQSGKRSYKAESTSASPHYKPQGDKGSETPYVPSAMPDPLSERYPVY